MTSAKGQESIEAAFWAKLTLVARRARRHLEAEKEGKET